jgi:VWFA-related protein
MPRSTARLVAALLLAAVASLTPTEAATKPKNLDPKYQQWLGDAAILMTKEERKAFLELEKDYQRDAFIRRFWEARDSDPATEVNEFKERYYSRLEEAKSRFEFPQDDRRRFWVLHGPPGGVQEVDCGILFWPLQIWVYGYSELTGGGFTVIFSQSGGGGPFRVWRPNEGYEVLFALGGSNSSGDFYAIVQQYCSDMMYDALQQFIATIQQYANGDPNGPIFAERPPGVNDPEWLRTFHAFSTDAVEGAKPLSGEVEWQFPGRRGQRTVVAGRLQVPAAEAVAEEVAGASSYNFLLTGEILREKELFDSFRYRFDLPVRSGTGDNLYLLFERYLRPGSYGVVLKLEDVNGGGVLRRTLELEVPEAEGEPAVAAAGGEGEAQLEEPTEARIELAAQDTELQSGKRRFVANVSGSEVAKVRFLLDDEPVLTKTRPPYSVELDLGNLPVTHTVRALALDRSGNEVATDELLLNAGEHTFIVRVVEPRQGERYSGSVLVRADVRAPRDLAIERVEFFLGDTRVATLYQPPFSQRVPLEHEDLAFVRVAAYLEDGNSSDDLVVFNTAQFIEDVSVRMVELFATVVDPQGRPIEGLEQEQFRVTDNGEPQTILRFERLDDLPIYASLLLDTSASMAESLEEVRRVALGFLEETITPRDRACVITFNETPRLAAEFTNDLTRLGGGLAGLTAERSTALYDSLMFGLYYFKGIKGQKALIVLSDGQDRRSEATFDQVLDFARSSGVTLYTIGFKLGKGGKTSRGRLQKMAAETGGQSFFVQSASELGGIYAAIQKDLRSRYFLAYQPALDGDDGFRRVAVTVAVDGADVRTMSGYLP